MGVIKRIACFATIKPSDEYQTYSEQVFSIYDSARRFNKEHGLLGVFVVHGQILLQILEGEPNTLAKALYRVNRDPRIKDISVILNKSFERPAFSRWSIKMIKGDGEAHREFLTRLKQIVAPYAVVRLPQDCERFRTLFGATNIAANNALTPDANTDQALRFRGHTLAMSAWPRPTQLRLSAPLMKLCQILIGHSVSYQKLWSMGLFESETELNRQLDALYQANALEVFRLGDPNNVHTLPEPSTLNGSGTGQAPVSRSRFSQALKQFIQGQKSKRLSSP